MSDLPRPGALHERPNILLIVSDQHRLDCLGVSNDYPVSTPNLDALARAGVHHRSAFTPIPLCSPARQSLLTGIRAESTGGLWNYDLGSRIPALDPSEFSWPRELQRSGYHSQYIGKWHVNPHHDPTSFGYDSWIPLEAYARWRDAEHPEHPISEDWLGGIDPVPTAASRTHWMADRAIDFIRDASEGADPWHLRLDFLEPHLPCQPTQEFAQRYSAQTVPKWRDFEDALVGKPYIQRQQLLNWGVEGWSWEDWAPIVARYYAVITQLDDAIGSVLRALDEAGAEDTLVVYTTDHGDLCGSHGMMDKHYVMYDEVVKVPLIVRWPDRIAANSVSNSFVYNMLDLAPTISAASGTAGPSVAHGVPLFDEQDGMLAPSAAAASRDHVVASYNGQQFGLFTQRMIRTRSWKYVWNPTDVDELYDLTADPEELANRIDDATLVDVLQDLRIRLYQHLLDEGDSIVGNDWMAAQLIRGTKLGNGARGALEEEHV